LKSNKQFWLDRNVFVTGCSGFLGSWLVQYLVNLKANVVGLIRDELPLSRLYSEKIIDSINVVHGCLENYELIERIINEYEIEMVFHIAAQTIVRIANRNPISTFNSNIQGTWNILEACRRNPNVKQIIIASSDKAYGEQDILPYNESNPMQGSHPYDVSKSCADLIAQTYFKTYKLPICITRCGNFYGGGDLNFNRIVPGTIRSLIRNEQPIIRSDGKLIRDYIYIEDVVNAYILLAEKMAENPKIKGEAFNFSCENPISVLELVNLIIKIFNKNNLKPVILNNASNEIPKQYLSAKKATKILNWRPIYTLEDGLKKTISWYENLLND
jgi:CDP-glucose 4,6-dehydratase